MPPEGFRSTGLENVSANGCVKFRRPGSRDITEWERTIEKGISYKATRIDSSAVYGSEGLAIAAIEGLCTDSCTLELVGIETFYISTMILEEVGELVVEKDGMLQFCRNIEFDDALSFGGDIGDGCVGCVVEKSVSRGCWFGIVI